MLEQLRKNEIIDFSILNLNQVFVYSERSKSLFIGFELRGLTQIRGLNFLKMEA